MRIRAGGDQHMVVPTATANNPEQHANDVGISALIAGRSSHCSQ